MKVRFLFPLGIFLVMAVFLGIGLTLNPRDVPSVLIDEKAPELLLPDLFDSTKTVDSKDYLGKVWMLNIWGTWCPECWREHDFLNQLAEKENIRIIGINWRDDPDEAKEFLKSKGNPFAAVGADPNSEAVMNWGVYGAPETFIIDKKGFIRKKYTGPLYGGVWETEFRPLIAQLEKEL